MTIVEELELAKATVNLHFKGASRSSSRPSSARHQASRSRVGLGTFVGLMRKPLPCGDVGVRID